MFNVLIAMKIASIALLCAPFGQIFIHRKFTEIEKDNHRTLIIITYNSFASIIRFRISMEGQKHAVREAFLNLGKVRSEIVQGLSYLINLI